MPEDGGFDEARQEREGDRSGRRSSDDDERQRGRGEPSVREPTRSAARQSTSSQSP
jgi:hypothetical protein